MRLAGWLVNRSVLWSLCWLFYVKTVCSAGYFHSIEPWYARSSNIDVPEIRFAQLRALMHDHVCFTRYLVTFNGSRPLAMYTVYQMASL